MKHKIYPPKTLYFTYRKDKTNTTSLNEKHLLGLLLVVTFS